MRILYIVLMILLCMTPACMVTSKTITGTVIDAETGKAIEGAVVLVEWTKAEGVPGMASTKSYKVVEVVTDKDGKFIVEDVKKILIDSPDVTVYKKGYVAWSSRIIFPDWRNRTDFKWGKTDTFKLEHFRPEYSYDKHTSFIHSVTNSSIATKQIIAAAYRWEELKASDELDEKWRKLQNKRPETSR